MTSNIIKKSWYKPLITLSLLITAVAIFYGFVGLDVAEASLRSKVTSSNGEELTNTIDNAGASIIATLRQIAIIVCVLLCVWMGYSVWIKKTAEGLADIKGRLLALVIGLAFVFFAEQIIGTLLGWFGYKA